MNTAAKLSAYGAAVALFATGAYALGTAVGPLTSATTDTVHSAEGGGAAGGGHGDTGGGTVEEAAETASPPGGLASSAGGYTLVPDAPTLIADTPETFKYRITGPDGAPVTAFDTEHDKQMHLVVVRRDTTGFQHLHPDMAPDGTWSVPLAVDTGGSYRAFADFTPTGGDATTLGVDLAVAGSFDPVTQTETRTAQVDGYTVELTGDLVPGQASPVTLSVSRDGQPVADLQPYLGAYGHLVALRGGDLAYLRVHPGGEPGDGTTPAGPQVAFVAEVPSAGTYRLFLDFQRDGVVRTAEFTVPTAGAPADSTAAGGAAAGATTTPSTDGTTTSGGDTAPGHTDQPGAPGHGH